MKTNYTTKEATSRNITDDFKMFDNEGNTNFYIKPAIAIDGELLGGYDVYMGKKLFGYYKTIKGAKIGVMKTFAQDKNGNGLIPKEEIKFIIISIADDDSEEIKEGEVIMYNEELKAQYCIMTEEQKDEKGYLPNYDALISEAPNEEMKQKWKDCQELFEKAGKHNARLGRFAFKGIYMIQMKCGHYEIFQHATRSEEEMINWITLMKEPKHYKKCSRCICGGY